MEETVGRGDDLSDVMEFDWSVDYRLGWRLVKISPQDLTEQDLFYLIRAAEADQYGVTAKDYLHAALEKDIRLWRIVGNGEGILGTRILQHPAGRELLVEFLAGRKVAKGLSAIYASLEPYAREHGCKWIALQAARPEWEKVIPKQVPGFEKIVARMRKEI